MKSMKVEVFPTICCLGKPLANIKQVSIFHNNSVRSFVIILYVWHVFFYWYLPEVLKFFVTISLLPTSHPQGVTRMPVLLICVLMPLKYLDKPGCVLGAAERTVTGSS